MSRRSVLLLAGALAAAAGCDSARRLQTPVTPAGNEALASCTGCHGDQENGNAAPPRPVVGDPAPTNRRVGVHQAHLVDSAIAQAIACSECHAVPANVNSPGHMDSNRASFVWGPLASADGVTPTATAPDDTDTAPLTCTNYCHGASLGGGLRTSPVWNTGVSNQAGCGTCHGIPPPAPHPVVTPSATACSACHADTIDARGVIDVAGGKHINGIVDVTGGPVTTCTICHGDASRQPTSIASAPPRDVAGNTATTAPGVGAHQAHLTTGTLRIALACSDCHRVPTDFAHAQQPLDLTWGALARAGGATPSFTAANVTCTNYCHGATLQGGNDTTPVWTGGASQAACGTCHGLPPSTGHHGGSHTGQPCSACHGAGYNSGVDTTRHVNGAKDVGGVGSAIISWTRPSCVAACHSGSARNW